MPSRNAVASKLIETRLPGRMPSTAWVKSTKGIGKIITLPPGSSMTDAKITPHTPPEAPSEE